jgi:DNA-binding response OmpR family regulator
MKKEGYQVFIARDGVETRQILAEQIPDLVILDIMMPEVDGYQICKEIKDDKGLNQTKIIFLSAKNQAADLEKGYALGADLYLTKPFSTRNLAKQVAQLLGSVQA